MLTTDRLDRYVTLLAIRRSAAKRNALIIGALLLVSVLIGVALNVVTEPNGRSLFLETALTIMLGLGFVAAWSRYEAIEAIVELANELQAH